MKMQRANNFIRNEGCFKYKVGFKKGFSIRTEGMSNANLF